MRDAKKVLVLGAGEVGRSMVKRYLAEGCKVLVCDEEQAKLDALAQEYPEVGVLLAKQLSATDQAAGLTEEAAEKLGGLDVYVHTLDDYEFTPLESMDYDAWRKVRTNCLDTAFVWGQAVGRKLRDLQKGGYIFYVISDACVSQDPNMAAHYAAHWGVKGLIRCMALALGPYGITTNAIGLGVLDTEESEEGRRQLAAYLGLTPAELRGKLLGETLTGRMQTADEAAELCAFLTWEAININGQALLLNSGRGFN